MFSSAVRSESPGFSSASPSFGQSALPRFMLAVVLHVSFLGQKDRRVPLGRADRRDEFEDNGLN